MGRPELVGWALELARRRRGELVVGRALGEMELRWRRPGVAVAEAEDEVAAGIEEPTGDLKLRDGVVADESMEEQFWRLVVDGDEAADVVRYPFHVVALGVE